MKKKEPKDYLGKHVTTHREGEVRHGIVVGIDERVDNMGCPYLIRWDSTEICTFHSCMVTTWAPGYNYGDSWASKVRLNEKRSTVK